MPSLLHTILGEGILSWHPSERRSKRYGSINLSDSNFNEDAKAEFWLNQEGLGQLQGKRVRLWCIVLEERTSGHMGDLNLGLRPIRANRHEMIQLGVGILTLDCNPIGTSIGLHPSDGRQHFWLDPRKLYRLHDQTVQLQCIETDQPDHVVEPFQTTGQTIDFGNDGQKSYFQLSGDEWSDPNIVGIELEPKIEEVEGGFLVSRTAVPIRRP